ncbi:hypothetical protein CISIN_1g0327842mg, partial [Citrus sinensis]
HFGVMLELDWTNTNPDIHVTQQVANFRKEDR